MSNHINKVVCAVCVLLLACGSEATVGEVGTADTLATDEAVADQQPTETIQTDTGQADLSAASPCGPFGFCQPAGQSTCGSPNFVMTQMGCSTDSGEPGSCCIPRGECQTDADCPGCELCDLPAEGGTVCVDPLGTSGTGCTKKHECPEDYCCSFTLFRNKPECGGFCVYDGGTAECDQCTAEGKPVYGGDLPCCYWLEAIPMTMAVGEGDCIPGRAIGSMVCVLDCGDGKCTTGEDACNCPRDCPQIVAAGPGAPCTEQADCKSPGDCLPEASGYPTGGYCTGGVCNPDQDVLPCPVAGTICVGTSFSAAYLCLPACRSDADCRPGLTCEALSEQTPSHGEYICWENDSAMLGLGLGQSCTSDDDCISQLCLAHPQSGQKVCSAFCNAEKACKQTQTCSPMGGCGDLPDCGACFTLQ